MSVSLTLFAANRFKNITRLEKENATEFEDRKRDVIEFELKETVTQHYYKNRKEREEAALKKERQKRRKKRRSKENERWQKSNSSSRRRKAKKVLVCFCLSKTACECLLFIPSRRDDAVNPKSQQVSAVSCQRRL